MLSVLEPRGSPKEPMDEETFDTLSSGEEDNGMVNIPDRLMTGVGLKTMWLRCMVWLEITGGKI